MEQETASGGSDIGFPLRPKKCYLVLMKQAVIFSLALLAVALFSYRLGMHQATMPDQAPVMITAETSAPLARLPAQEPVVLPQPAPPQTHKEAMAQSTPFTQNLRCAEAGFEAAKTNLAEALSRIARLPTQELKGFVTGVFSFVAANHSPSEALGFYKQLPKRAQNDALRALVAEWATADGKLNEEQRYLKREEIMARSGRNLGLEVELAYSLASARPDAGMVKAWLENFSAHPARSEMLMALSRSTFRENPDSVLELTSGWSGWERERAIRHTLETLTRESPEKAWQWYLDRRGQLPQDLSSSIFTPWANSNPAALQQMLATLQDPAQRLAAVESLGKVLAVRHTDEAVAWANSLLNPEEKNAAHRSIYEAVPRGIGAAIGLQDGFPTLHAIIPGSPLEGSGLQPGDRIVEVRASDGASHALYGKELVSTINLIRGEPGTEITLRILRPNETTGQVQEYLLPVRRQQLYLNETGAEP